MSRRRPQTARGETSTHPETALPPGPSPSKELAIIEDTRPWHERVWDLDGRETWEARTLEALQAGDLHKLEQAVTVLEWTNTAWAQKPGRRVRHPRAIEFDTDIIDKHFQEEQTLIHHWRMLGAHGYLDR
jgi:hypothetical protein